MGDIVVTPVTGVADLSASWLTAALAGSLAGAAVTAVAAAPVGTGQVADTYRLALDYGQPGAGPATLIAKVPSADPTSRAAAQLTRTYEIEASFYRDLAADLPVRAPRCYYQDHVPATDDYVVLLEDVAPAEQGDQLAGCTCAQIEGAIDELAHLHGARWGDPALRELDWLHRSTPEGVDQLVALITGCAGDFHTRFDTRLAPAAVALVDRLVDRLGPYLHRRPEPWTVTHGDFRADNLLFGGDGVRVVVVDWQTVGLGPPAGDLAYLLGTSLSVERRRATERDLVGRYTDGVRAHGADVDDEWLWTEYRRGAFAGLLMAIIASVLVRQTDRGDDMFVAMAERSATMAADLAAASLLPA